jgi:hypothetical protein
VTEQNTAPTPAPCVSCGDPSDELFPGGQPVCDPCRLIAWELFSVLPSETTTAQMRDLICVRREAERAAERAVTPGVGQFTTEQLDRLALALFRGGFDLPHGDPSGDYVGTENRDALSAALLAADFTLDTPATDHAWPLAEAIRLTVEYLGTDMLPAREGWSWYDALRSYAPVMAQRFVDQPVPMGHPLPHLDRTQAELLGAALSVFHEACIGHARHHEAAADAELSGTFTVLAEVHTSSRRGAAVRYRNRAAAAAELAELLGVGIEGDGSDEEAT